ncbi:MAG: hypothetical protein CMN58_08160 [Solibacterales bacterium]|nr:hypothetical protein [Bryobacterales bacterium]|tara:strand:+ start:305 stop:910 length:606 start_codon:yes stop_codon:yes gene_type:complete
MQVMPGDLELLDSELTLKVGKNDYRITGRIKNTSAARDAEIAISTTKTISSLQIFFQLYDATGNQVGKAMDICCADVTPKREPRMSSLRSLETANLLMPGDTWNVIASDLGAVKRANKKAVSFRFDKITADLGGISHKTVPLTNLPSGLRVPFRSKLTPEQRKSGVYTDEDVLREVSKRRDSLKKRIQKAADRASRSMGKR